MIVSTLQIFQVSKATSKRKKSLLSNQIRSTMNKKFTLGLLVLTFLFALVRADAACVWKTRNPYFYAYDSCSNSNQKASVNAYFSIQSNSSCLKYTWKVNGVTVPGSNLLHKVITKNGSYVITLNVRDTCNNCDTTFTSSTRTITCLNSCRWANSSRQISFNAWDSCNGRGKNKVSLNAYITPFNGCYKYLWTLNGVAINTSAGLQVGITKNGSYNLCVKITDSCSQCDTTYCKSFTITCATNCNWSSKNATFGIDDSCSYTKSKPNFLSYIYFQNTSTPCLKYTWKVNGTTIYTGTSTYISYFPTQNGTYNVTVNVRDTCSNCDTTYSKSVTITCASSCKWFKRNLNFNTWDSCNGRGQNKVSINGEIGPQNGCYKYAWIVNGYTVQYGSRSLNMGIGANGTYNLCVKITDTCNKCDTTLCRTFNISCVPKACNWKSRNLALYAKDSCNKNTNSSSITSFITISNNSCLKYLWKVNGVIKSNSYYFNYPVYANGQYTVCLTLTDTCLKCDTSICFTKTISCLSSCNWKSRNPYTYAWDSCKGTSSKLNAYVSFNYNRASCFKYTWTINGKQAGTGNVMSYPITQNGTYTLCVKVVDTCNQCDTTLCFNKTINCFSTCNWKTRINVVNYFDSCNGKGYPNSLNAYVAMKQNSPCVKYKWTINGAVVSNTYYFHAPIYMNGAYNVCLKLTDSCAKCDTTICSRRVVNCNNLGIKTNDLNVVKIYPNPASSSINIDLEVDAEYTEILSIDGKTIWSGKLEAGSHNIQTEQWARGIYLVRIKTVTGISNYKITLE